MTVSTTTTAVSAAGDGSTTDFTFTFEILAAEDLKVIVVTDSTGAESEKTLTTDYTVAGVGQVSGGTVTFVTAPASGETVHIKRGNMALTQPTNYTPNDPFPAETHENALDRIALQIQQINEKVGRAVVRSETDSASAQLPTNETLKGKTLAFNETTGAVEAGPSIADVDTVSGIAADIATLADIEDGTDATDAIQTVASISGDVTTVSGISSDVTNVSNNAASVSTVAGDSANISTVAGNITDVATVSSNITSVSTVASNISDVVTVANDLNEAISEVETVANDLNEAVSEIDTVATSISSVQTVGTNIANVNTVAGIDSDVTTVSGISGNVTTVAGISSDVTTVSGVSADVSTVSGVSANVTTVAGISSDVTTVAGNSANVTTVATDITNVNTVASNIADVNNFALTYRIAASAPTTSLDEGDLYFNTTLNQMFVYDGSAWASVSPDLVGDTSPQLGGNLDTNGNDITFGDNDKAIFGSAADGLQIYNTAAGDKFISEAGSGNLKIQGDNLYLQNSAGTENHIIAISDAAVTLHYDSAPKLATTATGVDVTGTITSDGLTVDDKLEIDGASSSFGGTAANAYIMRTDGLGSAPFNAAGSLVYQTRTTSGDGYSNHLFYTGDPLALRQNIKANGDISFYDSTGVTQGFFWDASTQQLGLGTTSPSFILDATGDKDTWVSRIYNSGSDANAQGLLVRSDATAAHDAFVLGVYADSEYKFAVKSSGNVGIGTSSPQDAIHIAKASAVLRLEDTDTNHISTIQSGGSGLIISADAANTEASSYMAFNVDTSEAARIDSSGNLVVGATSAYATNAITLGDGGILYSRRTSGGPLTLRRDSTDGAIATFEKDGTTVGVIGTQNWGIGTASPDEKLDVRGTIQVGIDGTTAGEIRFMDSGSVTEEATISSDANGGLIFGGNSGPGELIFRTGSSTERLRISSAGNLQAGATSGRGGASTGHLFKMPSGDIYFEIMGNAAGSNTDILFSDGTGGSYGVVGYDHTNDALRFFANSGEKMRIDSSGNLLVGKTSSSFATDGGEIKSSGQITATANNASAMQMNRRSSDGPIVNLAKDGSTVGQIGAKFSGRSYIASGSSANTGVRFDTNFIAPADATGANRDNAIDLGSGGARFDDVFATNGTIQTSDANEKQQIAILTDAEITAAKAISQLFKTFKWNSSVTERGDAARTHTGVIAQDVEAAMTAAGLDAGDYAFFISTDWYVDADGNEVEADAEGAIAKNRKGIRYPELLSFVGAATEQRLANIETRLAALEAN